MLNINNLPTANPEAVQDSYYAYLEEISQYKLLSTDEEIAIFQMIQEGDNVAKELFIKSNLRLVAAQAKRFHYPGYNSELDLIQEGNIGLMRAIDLYDPQRGCKFSTFAIHHINKAIRSSASFNSLPLTLSAPKLSLLHKIKGTIELWEAEKGAKPSFKQLSEHLNVSISQIREIFPFVLSSLSLNAKLSADPDSREVGDVFFEHYKSDSEDIENACIIKETRDELRKLIYEVLSDKEAYILLSRWGVAGYTIKDVATLADELNMSKQGIRQSEQRSIAKLKKHFLSLNKSLQDFI